MDVILETLICPLSGKVFADPVSGPCGHVFSRIELCHFIAATDNPKCPKCGAGLDGFDAKDAPVNVSIENLVKTLVKSKKPPNTPKCSETQKWSCKLFPLLDPKGQPMPWAQLELALENSVFIAKPTLFILIVDKSGSMMGDPMRQVREALIHIMTLTRSNPFIKMVLISYNHVANIEDTSGSLEQTINTINQNIQASGGNNEEAAFRIVGNVLEKYTCSNDPKYDNSENNVSNVTIAFLTDGQACRNRKELIDILNEVLDKNWNEKWNAPLCIHTIGFSGSCDRAFLEDVRQVGNIPGIFRYAEPQDDGDTLCMKLQSIFDSVSESSQVQLSIACDNVVFKDGQKFKTVQFPIGSDKKGKLSLWVKPNNWLNPGTICINSHLDQNVQCTIHRSKAPKNILQKWIEHLVDGLASEILELGCSTSLNRDLVGLRCALLKQRIEILEGVCKGDVATRLEFISEQLNQLESGKGIHAGKLGDLRFASKFGGAMTTSTNKPKYQPLYQPPKEPLAIPDEPTWKERMVRYSRNNTNKGRNGIQQLLTTLQSNKLFPHILEMIEKLTLEDIVYTDVDKNNTLHLAAYCGQNNILSEIMKKFPNLDEKIVNAKNKDDETPATLAIKRQGFYHVVKILFKHGAEIPDGRKDDLQQFAVNQGFEVTGKILSGIGDSAKVVNHSMSEEFVEFLYETAIENNVEMDLHSYLDVACGKCMARLVKKLVKVHKAVPDIDILLTRCIPPKPDHPETDKYLEITKLILNANPALLEQTNKDGETPLFKAAEKGSLPHVQYFLNKGAQVDHANELGNTPLWVACAKRYPCIIAELINWKADVNRPNKKGNPPMYGLCQKQNTPIKIVQQLLAAHATIDQINKQTGDTLLLICCRNGKDEILELFLKKVDPEFAKYKAHIDGFDAILAATEANQPECIRVLHESGIVDLESKTDDDNAILAGATPLHLAAFYDCRDAAKALLEFGVNANPTDINQQTPMHLAVIQGNVNIVKLLRNKGADTSAKDKFGNTPASYCRNRPDIRKQLVDPALDILIKLARGEFGKENADIQKQACNILMKSCGEPGFLEPGKALDVIDHDGSTPLMHAILCKNIQVAKTFFTLGADPEICNYQGLDSWFWAIYLGMEDCFQGKQVNANVGMQIKRLQNTCQCQQDKDIVSFGTKDVPKYFIPNSTSILCDRMDRFIMALYTVALRTTKNVDQNQDSASSLSDSFDDSSATLEIFENDSHGVGDNVEDKAYMWNAKIFTVGLLASENNTSKLTPQHAFAISLYTSHLGIAETVNNLDNRSQYRKCLKNTLKRLQPYQGEVFIGANKVDRRFFQIGEQIQWSSFTSASTLWKVAMNHLLKFDQKKQAKGTMFIIHSRTGRFVGQYSPFSYDAEVIFRPKTKFQVKAWYRGDKICLGQANIREHTFGIKDEQELRDYATSNKSLIIELVES